MDSKVAEKFKRIESANRSELTGDQFMSGPVEIGMSLFVEYKLGEKASYKARTRLVGFAMGKYLIVETPKIKNQRVTFKMHNKIFVRYVAGGCIYGFRTSMIESILTPYDITFLKYPEIIEQISLRGAPRIQVVIPYALVDDENSDSEDCEILDISATGALLRVNHEVAIDDTFVISFTLPNSEEIVDMECIIRRLNITKDRTIVGVEFDKENETYRSIDKYITHAFDSITRIAEKFS